MLPIFADFKKHCKNRYFTFLKDKSKKYILRGYYLVQVGVVIWSKLGAFKNANLDQIITPEILRATFLFKNNVLKPLKNKLGPENNP